jgi:hypothetical protein
MSHDTFIFMMYRREYTRRESGGPPNLLFIVYQGSFLGLKQLGCEFDHASPPSAKVKNDWSCTSKFMA